MSQYQKQENKALIKTKNETQLIKNGKQTKPQLRKINYPDNKIKIKSTNETINYTTKTHYPNIKFSSLNKFKINRLSNKSFNIFNTSQKYSTITSKNINRNLIVLNSFGSSKDLRKKINYDNHSIFISGPPETPQTTYTIKFDTEKKFYPKNNLNKEKEEINSTKKKTTTLYKRRNDNENSYYSNFYTLNDINKASTNTNSINNNYRTNNKNAFNYKINSITCKSSTNKKNEKPQNITEINNNKEIQTYTNKGKEIITTYIGKKDPGSRFRIDDNYTFIPKEDLSIDNKNLIFHRLRRNETAMDKKCRLKTMNNSPKEKNFFFNPFKKDNKLSNNQIISFPNNLNKEKEKLYIETDSNKNDVMKRSETFFGLRKNNDPKKKIINDSKLNYKDRRTNKNNLIDNQTERKKIDLIKKKIIRINENNENVNKINSNKNKINNSEIRNLLSMQNKKIKYNIIRNDLKEKNEKKEKEEKEEKKLKEEKEEKKEKEEKDNSEDIEDSEESENEEEGEYSEDNSENYTNSKEDNNSIKEQNENKNKEINEEYEAVKRKEEIKNSDNVVNKDNNNNNDKKNETIIKKKEEKYDKDNEKENEKEDKEEKDKGEKK